MKLLKVAAAILNQTPLDWARNQAHIVAAIRQARTEGVSLLCLPELCITGYGCEDAFHSPGMHETAWNVLKEILPETRGMVVSAGLPIVFQNALFNTAVLLVDGQIAGFVAKRYLAGDGIHYEPRWFKPWPEGVVEMLHGDGEAYPIGDIHFDCGGIKIGFEICEDAWVARRPGASLALRGVDVILNPSASHFAFGKLETRKQFVLEGSRAFGVAYVYANLVGNEAGRAIYDGGAMIASRGNPLATGPRFSMVDWDITASIVDITLSRMTQLRTASFIPKIDADHHLCIPISFDWPVCEPETKPPIATAEWETSPHIKEEEFTRAETLALFDYMRKSQSRGFVVSLSGGVDSAAVSALVASMIERGVAELGLQGFKDKLRYWPALGDATSAVDLFRQMLTCVYQSTENSSKTTLEAAQTLTAALGATFLTFDVDPLAKAYVRIVGDAIGLPLTWERDDVALQNIQARTRAPGVWLLANLRNALLLATSNRSEAAVGYATMDGDTCGGLSPIAGIDKAFLRRWSQWMEAFGPTGLKPIPALACVNALTPTAELRPAAASQTDEDDLMPYDLLDAIERAAIRDRRMPVEVFHLIAAHFPQYSRQQLSLWIERFFRLWSRNQWKRERYAPSFHLDDENLDPKTWCRFPILSGGFERELAELRSLLTS
jgi:NAD+ synthase (glutamine-hydrolysing)